MLANNAVDHERLKRALNSRQFTCTYSVSVFNAQFYLYSAKYRNNLRMHSVSNEKEIEGIKSSYVHNMTLALTYHSKCLSTADTFNLVSVFRLVAIWFDNEANTDVRQIIQVTCPPYCGAYMYIYSRVLHTSLHRLLIRSEKRESYLIWLRV